MRIFKGKEFFVKVLTKTTDDNNNGWWSDSYSSQGLPSGRLKTHTMLSKLLKTFKYHSQSAQSTQKKTKTKHEYSYTSTTLAKTNISLWIHDKIRSLICLTGHFCGQLSTFQINKVTQMLFLTRNRNASNINVTYNTHSDS